MRFTKGALLMVVGLVLGPALGGAPSSRAAADTAQPRCEVGGPSPEAERALARAQSFERQGAFAWKTGLVQRELAEARRHQPELVLPPYAWPQTAGERNLPEKPVEPSSAPPASVTR